MKRKSLDYAVIVAMLVIGFYVAITGLVMDLLNLPMIAFHDYAGYACAVLAGVHLSLNWKRIKGFLPHRIGEW